MKIHEAILAGLVLGLSTAEAKTLALWPIEYDADLGECNLRCANNPAYDLTDQRTLTPKDGADAIGWNLPPNPDTSAFLFTPLNRYALYATGDGYLKAQEVGRLITEDKPYTLEGFVKFTAVGGWGATWVILSSVAPFATGQQDFRLVAKDGKYYLRFAVQRPSKIDTEFAGPGLTADEVTDGKWHHWAYTYQPNDGNGRRVIEAFWDGQSAGTLGDAAVTATYANNGELMLGSRGQYGNTIRGAMDYVRLSDEVLAPDQFLNHGAGGTVVTAETSPTVGYWRLGTDASGLADLSSAIGGAGFYAATMANHFSTTSPKVEINQGRTSLYPTGEGAFEGQPANPTVALDGGNQGAFVLNGDANARQYVNGLGAELALSKDFTVETYFRPDTRDRSMTGSRGLFGVMTNGKGWCLMMAANNRSSAAWGRRLRLSVSDTGVVEGSAFWHADFLPRLDAWRDEWKHLALVHEAKGGASGCGKWTLYIDGVENGTLAQTFVVKDPDCTTFTIGTVGTLAAPGAIDCLRVSAAALAPSQFVCTPNGTAATDVKAFFPLDTSAHGSPCAYFKDVVGGYTIGEEPAAMYRPAAVTDDAPTVTRPDASEKLRLVKETGSVDFAAGGANDGVFCCDAATLTALNATSGDRSVTIEAFVKLNTNGGGYIFIGSPTALDNYWPGMNLYLSYTAGSGLKFSDTRLAKNAKFQDRQTTVKMSENVWHHVALVLSHDETTATCRLYVDGGEPQATYTEDFNSSCARSLAMICTGGRYWTTDRFNGRIAHLRVSKGALAPSEFLNGAPPEAETPATVAYWPLDWRNATLDLKSRVTSGYDFTGGAEGSALCAYRTNWHASVAAEAVRNRGSVVVAAGTNLVARSVARDWLSLTKPFTLEGCVRLTSPLAETTVVCGTYRKDFGWQLVCDASGGVPRLRLYGCGRPPAGAFVNDAFDWDASALAVGWHQIALAYDTTGTGTWTLFVDGEAKATLANRWCPKALELNQLDLSVDLAAGYDVWRLSSGVRTADELLYNPLTPGLYFILR